jgi:tetratricopeptide (TPR) repeat protein
MVGRQEEGLGELRRAAVLDPVSPVMPTDLGFVLCTMHQPDLAIRQFQKALELDGNFGLAHEYLALAYAQKREFPDAIREIHKALVLENGELRTQARMGSIYAMSGDRAAALNVLDSLREAGMRSPVSPEFAASIYSGLGDNDRAILALQTAIAEHDVQLVGIKIEPAFDDLHSDARFQQVLRRIGL